MLVLSGGTGTPKLLLGLKEHLLAEDLSVVVNTAEDLWVSGNYITPDIDSVLYTLADMIDEKKWWGIKGDKTATHDALAAMGLMRSCRWETGTGRFTSFAPSCFARAQNSARPPRLWQKRWGWSSRSFP